MAKRAMSNTADTLPQKKGPSLVVQLGAARRMTAAAAGTGWVSGGYLDGGQDRGRRPRRRRTATAPLAEASDGHGAAAPSETVITACRA